MKLMLMLLAGILLSLLLLLPVIHAVVVGAVGRNLDVVVDLVGRVLAVLVDVVGQDF